MFFARPKLAATLLGLVALAGLSGNDANAQQIFRIVGPDGRITFSDKPPLDPTVRAKPAPAALPGGGANELGSLPFDLRQAASRYPVVLYTAPGCSVCASGRAMLAGRGIPFAEKTVVSNDDIEALKRMSSATTLPLLTVGGQQIKGYSDGEWNQFLDAAGYPKTSQLPASYTARPATPMVAVQDTQTAPAPAPVRRAAVEAPVEAPAPAAENPSGIRF
jgi:glutaredoxin